MCRGLGKRWKRRLSKERRVQFGLKNDHEVDLSKKGLKMRMVGKEIPIRDQPSSQR